MSDFKGLFIGLLFFLTISSASGQESPAVIGWLIRPIIPSGLFDNRQLDIVQNKVKFSIVPRLGWVGGIVLRHGLYGKLSFESGINYTYRVYGISITDSTSFNTTNKFRLLTYEIPFQGLIYIRMAKNVYMNTAFGLSLDFFPNDVHTENEYYKQLALRNYWVLPALTANVGVEWRTKKSGYFDLGGSYHRMLARMADTQIRYTRGAIDEQIITGLSGHYFSIDLKYFLPNTSGVPHGD